MACSSASSFLLLGDNLRQARARRDQLSAAGTLLGVAPLALLPQGRDTPLLDRAFRTLLAGVMTFFMLVKFVLWRHCHDGHECEVHTSAASLVIIGDAFHTFVDGAVIAAAVLTSIPLGVTIAIAVATHEISGSRRRRDPAACRVFARTGPGHST